MPILLGQYRAYMPPFKMEVINKPPYIGGIEGSPPWSEDLENRLKKAYDEWRDSLEPKITRIPSASQLGVWYTVSRTISEGQVLWNCTCPARCECWHIRVVRGMEEKNA